VGIVFRENPALCAAFLFVRVFPRSARKIREDGKHDRSRWRRFTHCRAWNGGGVLLCRPCLLCVNLNYDGPENIPLNITVVIRVYFGAVIFNLFAICIKGLKRRGGLLSYSALPVRSGC
jgi:hypothetical protein